MQTFLPYADLVESAQCLDDKRLGNQRREALGLINTVTGKTKGWRNHPAALMWMGYPGALMEYYDAIVREWKRRKMTHNGVVFGVKGSGRPWWLGDDRFHASHRAALLHKKPEWYRQFGWSEKPVIDYYWPVRSDEHGMVEVSAGRVIK
jgi:hypothetical protein